MKYRDDKRKEEIEKESLHSAKPCVVFFPDLFPLSSKNQDSLPKSSILILSDLSAPYRYLHLSLISSPPPNAGRAAAVGMHLCLGVCWRGFWSHG